MARDSETHKTDRELIEEIAQRARRTETRVTTVLNHLGVEHDGAKPELRGDILHVPTSKVSLSDVIAALRGTEGLVTIYCGSDYLAAVQL